MLKYIVIPLIMLLLAPIGLQGQDTAGIKTIKGGHTIDLSTLSIPGKVTVVELYADWCGPCRKLEPFLIQKTMEKDLAVIKLDMIDWKSPIAEQFTREFGLAAIPFTLVYDAKGKITGSVTGYLPEDIEALIQKARKKGGLQ